LVSIEDDEIMHWQGLTSGLTTEAVNASNFITGHSSIQHKCSPEFLPKFICVTPNKELINDKLNTSVSYDADNIKIYNHDAKNTIYFNNGYSRQTNL
jgi:hypothetical protein